MTTDLIVEADLGEVAPSAASRHGSAATVTLAAPAVGADGSDSDGAAAPGGMFPEAFYPATISRRIDAAAPGAVPAAEALDGQRDDAPVARGSASTDAISWANQDAVLAASLAFEVPGADGTDGAPAADGESPPETDPTVTPESHPPGWFCELPVPDGGQDPVPEDLATHLQDKMYRGSFLDEYRAFLDQNPTWPEENGAGGIQPQVVTPSAHLPWIELGTPGAASAFDAWYEMHYLTVRLPDEGPVDPWPEIVICICPGIDDLVFTGPGPVLPEGGTDEPGAMVPGEPGESTAGGADGSAGHLLEICDDFPLPILICEDYPLPLEICTDFPVAPDVAGKLPPVGADASGDGWLV